MSELIRRQDALDAIQKRADIINSVHSAFWEGLIIAYSLVQETPSAEPEPEEFEWCHDCREYDQEKHCCHRWTKVIRQTVEELKSQQPERKKGKWARRKDEDCWECSECHAVLENSDIGNHNFYYCYHCGADMMDVCGYMDLEKANYE